MEINTPFYRGSIVDPLLVVCTVSQNLAKKKWPLPSIGSNNSLLVIMLCHGTLYPWLKVLNQRVDSWFKLGQSKSHPWELKLRQRERENVNSAIFKSQILYPMDWRMKGIGSTERRGIMSRCTKRSKDERRRKGSLGIKLLFPVDSWG